MTSLPANGEKSDICGDLAPCRGRGSGQPESVDPVGALLALMEVDATRPDDLGKAKERKFALGASGLPPALHRMKGQIILIPVRHIEPRYRHRLVVVRVEIDPPGCLGGSLRAADNLGCRRHRAMELGDFLAVLRLSHTVAVSIVVAGGKQIGHRQPDRLNDRLDPASGFVVVAQQRPAIIALRDRQVVAASLMPGTARCP